MNEVKPGDTWVCKNGVWVLVPTPAIVVVGFKPAK
jgi:hypothetical protein